MEAPDPTVTVEDPETAAVTSLTEPVTATEPVATEEPGAEPKRLHDINRTYYPKLVDTKKLDKDWYIINAEGQTLGRLATLVAMRIRGKDRPSFYPSMDMGSYVIVVNAEKVEVSGRKFTDKKYFRHTTGRPGKWRFERFKELQGRIPERIIEKAVKGMLPKGRLGRRIFHHLKVYKGPNHPHEAQKPVDITHQISAKPSAFALMSQNE